MSLWTKFRNTAVRSVAAYYTGGASEAYFQNRDQQRAVRDAGGSNPMPVQTFTPTVVVAPNTSVKYGPGGFNPAEGARRAGPLGGAMTARGIYASAMSYCRRHPQWCASIGMPGVVQLITSGSLPPLKRRRRRGISATDLSKFRRVAGFLYKWGPMCATGASPRARTTRAKR